MRVFLTGATGFIGRHLAPALTAAGHSLNCLVRDPRRARWLEELPRCRIVQGSLADGALLERQAREADLIFHLAAATRAAGHGTPDEVNDRGTERLARAAAASGARLVYLSSLSAAGPRTSRNPSREEDPPLPVSVYGRSKLAGEEHVRRLLPGDRWTVVRAPAVYGPWDRDVLFLFRLAGWGFILQVAGVRTEVSLIHVEDLVRALLLAGSSETSRGRLYHVSDGKVYSRSDIAHALADQVERTILLPLPPFLLRTVGNLSDLASRLTGRPLLLGSDKVREAIQPGWVCSSARIAAELGFTARIGLREGFRSTWEWYRREGWL